MLKVRYAAVFAGDRATAANATAFVSWRWRVLRLPAS
jgi:hypothetical protein